MKRFLFSFLFILFLAVVLQGGEELYVPYSTQIFLKIESLPGIEKWLGEEFPFVAKLERVGIDVNYPVAYFHLSFPASFGFQGRGRKDKFSNSVGKVEETFKGITIYSLKEPVLGGRFGFFYKKRIFIFSDTGTGRKIIRVLKREETALGKEPYFKEGIRKTGKGIIVGFVNLRGIIENFLPFFNIMLQNLSQKEKDVASIITQVQGEEGIERLKTLEYVSFSLRLEREFLKLRKVVRIKTTEKFPEGKFTLLSYFPGESLVVGDFFINWERRRKETKDFYKKVREKAQGMEEDKKKLLEKIEELSLDFWKRMENMIYPEIGIGALYGENLPGFLIMGKVKDKKTLEDFWKNFKGLPSRFYSPRAEMKVKDLPSFIYRGGEIYGKELTFIFPPRQRKINIYFSAGDKFFLLGAGKDSEVIKKGWDSLKEEKNRVGARKDYQRLSSLLSPVGNAFIFFSASSVSGKEDKRGGAGVIRGKEGFLYSEVIWEKEDFLTLKELLLR